MVYGGFFGVGEFEGCWWLWGLGEVSFRWEDG